MSPAGRLRALIAQERLHVMSCCFDALSAKLIERAGFELTYDLDRDRYSDEG